MVTTIDKEKDKLRTAYFTPLEKSIFSDGEVVSVTGGFKESQPTTINSSDVEIKMVTSEHPINSDVSNIIFSNQEVPVISVDLEKIGVTSNGSTKFPNFESITLPLSGKKIKLGLKERIGSSFRWFAELLKRRMLLKPRTA